MASNNVLAPQANTADTLFGLPVGAQMIIGQSASDSANTVAYATLVAGGVGKRTYMTGYDVTGTGATVASTVLVTITGLPAGDVPYGYTSQAFTFPAGVDVACTPLIVRFPYPMRAVLDNYPIYITVPAGGAGNLHCTPRIYGFIL